MQHHWPVTASSSEILTGFDLERVVYMGLMERKDLLIGSNSVGANVIRPHPSSTDHLSRGFSAEEAALVKNRGDEFDFDIEDAILHEAWVMPKLIYSSTGCLRLAITQVGRSC
jgi:hypothetical protein